MRKIPSLDGIRAVSILLVLVGHVVHSASFPPAWLPFQGYFTTGDLGVRVFFVLSGYLITTILLHDERAHGRIRLGNFYERRALRILPVYFAFVIALALLDACTALDVSGTRYLTLLTFTKNMSVARWHDGHMWSLAVEQQFYLLWPVALVLLPWRGRIIALGAVVMLAALARPLFYAAHNAPWLNYSLPTNMDALILGAAAAMLAFARPDTVKAWVRFHPVAGRLLAIALMGGVWLLTNQARGGVFTVPFGPTVQAAAAAFLILSYAHETGGPAFRALNHPLMAGIGALSYSLYVWQQLFFVEEGDYAPRHPFFLHFPWNLGAIFLAATLSYFLIERPFFTLRRRLREDNAPGGTRPPDALVR